MSCYVVKDVNLLVYKKKKSLIQETNVDHMSTERSSLKSLEYIFYWFIFSKFTAYRNTLLVKGNCLWEDLKNLRAYRLNSIVYKLLARLFNGNTFVFFFYRRFLNIKPKSKMQPSCKWTVPKFEFITQASARC